MDEEQKDNQDLVVGGDGSMNQGTSIKVTTDEPESSEPAVNDIQAPPDSTEIEVKTDSPENNSEETTGNTDGLSDTSDDPNKDSENDNVVAAPETDTENTAEPLETSAGSGISNTSLDEKPDPFAPDKPSEPLAPTVPQTMSNNEQAKPHEHRNNKKLAVIVTVLVALLLASAAVYVYVSAQDNTKQTNSNSSESVPITEINPATTEDIDQSVAEIDEAILLLENDTDLSEETISDTSLGL